MSDEDTYEVTISAYMPKTAVFSFFNTINRIGNL